VIIRALLSHSRIPGRGRRRGTGPEPSIFLVAAAVIALRATNTRGEPVPGTAPEPRPALDAGSSTGPPTAGGRRA
jgi:hypothetical protein